MTEIMFDKTYYRHHIEMQTWCKENIGEGSWDGFALAGDVWSINNKFGNITFKFVNEEDLNRFKLRWERK